MFWILLPMRNPDITCGVSVSVSVALFFIIGGEGAKVDA